MSKKFFSGKHFNSARLGIVILGPVACLAGAFSALAGNPLLSVGVAILIGALLFGYFRFAAKPLAVPAAPEKPSVAPTSPASVISSDRIDQLTGLANENGLMAWFAEKAARLAADGKGIIVVTSDLADFDQVERTYGKAVADAVLIEVASRIATCTGAEGIAARVTGDEFAAIATVVPDSFEEFAAEQAGKLTDLIQRPVELASGVVWIGGSVGAACGAVSEGPQVLANAREALKKAQRIGRGHYVIYKNTPQ